MTPSLASRPSHALTVALVAILLATALSAPTIGQPPAAPQAFEVPSIGEDDRLSIIQDIASALDRVYIFPDVAKKMGDRMRTSHESGAYDELSSLPAFTQQLTEDLQAISKDLHLRVRFAPPPPSSASGRRPSPIEVRTQRQQAARRDNYCFRKVEHLAGNVGYLKFDCFMDAPIGGATAVSALNFLSNSDALIVDLRQNGGGSPSMIQLISSYFFKEATHLNSFYVRETDQTQEFWTEKSVKGEKMVDMPIYVLTSGRTFSAAEEFTYNLKHMNRATIVGQTTGGGAHPVRPHEVNDYPIQVSLPYGRAINPITGTNWEGAGVEPHIKVPAEEALETAHLAALEELEEAASDAVTKRTLATARFQLETLLHPAELSIEELRAFVGEYGPRSISLVDGGLRYVRNGRQSQALIPASKDRFFIEGTDNFYFRFERNTSGHVERILGHYPDGRIDQNERSGTSP